MDFTKDPVCQHPGSNRDCVQMPEEQQGEILG